MINLNMLRMMRMVRMSMKMSVTDMIDMSIVSSMNMCVHGGQATGWNGIHQHATIPPERSANDDGTVPFIFCLYYSGYNIALEACLLSPKMSLTNYNIQALLD